MSLGRDLLGQIAHARAQLLRRGHKAVHIVIGHETLIRLRHEAQANAVYGDWRTAPDQNQILGMDYEVRDDLEGWVVVGSQRRQSLW